jgi:hypothetical protein
MRGGRGQFQAANEPRRPSLEGKRKFAFHRRVRDITSPLKGVFMPAIANEQVEQNYEAFVLQLPALLQSHPGKFALMRDGRIVEFFDTARDAYFAGLKLYQEEGQFSVQEVVGNPVDLGFYSHALS